MGNIPTSAKHGVLNTILFRVTKRTNHDGEQFQVRPNNWIVLHTWRLGGHGYGILLIGLTITLLPKGTNDVLVPVEELSIDHTHLLKGTAIYLTAAPSLKGRAAIYGQGLDHTKRVDGHDLGAWLRKRMRS